ncbi:6-hydroxymethylpterin diphosphokinase MptE-like protein [Alteromonas hispanica]|uniref:DUF115 domain-containing protein n=1 Tax=Alteromonas hispanica TaxID=315421 RepID=A0A6L9MQX6_9ALTE|nr:6-hydroxymethylpterin diphosphokinase MptE-like protein [Alteromonas hispanica]NDW20644.1 DUF115 domain-containing protein [Alteromonas hispanica]
MMLKNINFYLAENEKHQNFIENKVSTNLKQNEIKSLSVFRRLMPALHARIIEKKTSSKSIFVNKDEELDIVDLSTGTALYGDDVSNSIKTHLQMFIENPPRLTHESKSIKSQKLPENVDVLVIFGVGLGLHILDVVKAFKVKHLIIYEPNIDYLRCSLYSNIWPQTFNVAKQKGTMIYLQSEMDGTSIFEDICSLNRTTNFDSVYYYQHYHSLIFDDVIKHLNEMTLTGLEKALVTTRKQLSFIDFITEWPPLVRSNNWCESNLDLNRFEKNLKAFERYFPNIAQDFSEYTANKWKPLANSNGEVNVFHVQTMVPLYSEEPKRDSERANALFKKRPNKEKLILGYSGGKLSHYSHYKMVKKIQDNLSDISEKAEELPEVVKSLLVFGVGVGYQIEELLNDRKVEKLFVCEPNRDFFYASLYAIDWKSLLERIDRNQQRVYLNIGDDGTNLVRDLLGQFHAIGTHTIANTYLTIGYENQALLPAINRLREDLRLIVAMGEYFEHSRFNLSHTEWAIENGIRFQHKPKVIAGARNILDVPVFVVGNGPSLDKLFNVIKYERENAIIISCGTALQALYSIGIVPDFHAEIEINRDSFDWLNRIDDPEYLRKIALISCAGVHPDTSSLFKSTLLTLKSGESSTFLTQKTYREDNLISLRHAYPTVSNFAVNWTLELGFKQLYLFGVDLGFADRSQHHSMASGYYSRKKGELYDYFLHNDTSLLVKGNFQPLVNTKYEFKMSKLVMENCINSYPRVDAYNLSNGAFIHGCKPLHKKDLLITSSDSEKKKALEWVLNCNFAQLDTVNGKILYSESFSDEDLINDIDSLKLLSVKSIKSYKDLEHLIEEHRVLLNQSYSDQRSKFYFLFNGSVNYLNSILTKLMYVSDLEIVVEKSSAVMAFWQEFINAATLSLSIYPSELDSMSSAPRDRQEALLRRYFSQNEIVLESNTNKHELIEFNKTLNIKFDADQFRHHYRVEIVKNIYDINNITSKTGKTAFIVDDVSTLEMCLSRNVFIDNNVVVFFPADKTKEGHLSKLFYVSVLALVSTKKVQLVVPKLDDLSWLYNFEEKTFSINQSNTMTYETRDMVVFTSEVLESEDLVNGAGDRFWLSFDYNLSNLSS